MDNLQLQNKLINIIYYDADGFGSIKNTFDKAKMIDPTLTYAVSYTHLTLPTNREV